MKYSLKKLKQYLIKTKTIPHSYDPKVLEEIGSIILKNDSSHDIEKVFLYGSRARGKNTSSSDYDIGIVAKKHLTWQMIMAIEAEIHKQFITQCHIIDINQTSEDFKKIIYSNPIVSII